MWNNAVKYLETKLEMNFFSIYNFYFLKERGDCLNKNEAAKYKCGISDVCDKPEKPIALKRKVRKRND